MIKPACKSNTNEPSQKQIFQLLQGLKPCLTSYSNQHYQVRFTQIPDLPNYVKITKVYCFTLLNNEIIGYIAVTGTIIY